ncbi:MAG: serine hydrolase domain-containing protein, partial [Flavobacteriaceae bacterium]
MRVLFFILLGIVLFQGNAQSTVPLAFSAASQISPEPQISQGNYCGKTLVARAVDSIITNGIKQEAFPGAQVLVAKNGKIIFHKAYGFHTYDSILPVGLSDLYDLASITKIIGPLPVIMKLCEEGVLDLDKPFGTYWKPWRKISDKKDLTLREILAHQAGLKPYIVFMEKVLKGNQLKHRYIRPVKSIRFQNQVYENLFVKNSFANTMYKKIDRSEIAMKKTYRYSGLAFLI